MEEVIFEIGDLIECINNSKGKVDLTEGRLYQIMKVSSIRDGTNDIIIKIKTDSGVIAGFLDVRFQKTLKTMIRTINDTSNTNKAKI